MQRNHSVDFFDAQFQRQIDRGEYALNPFESLALEHLAGSVLDLGCGLGNLSLEAGRRGHRVTAVDGSATAVRRIDAAARREGLPVQAVVADLGTWNIDRPYDTIVSIGLLMFFPPPRALDLLGQIQAAVVAGGRAVVNVLVEGTTYRAMFDPDSHHLFGRDELDRSFGAWRILLSRHDTFAATGDTLKEFSTVAALKPPRLVHRSG